MDIGEALKDMDKLKIGNDMYALAERLYPICRSITGNGFRQTLDIIGEYIDIERTEIPTGASVFDWTIPREWNISDAWIKDPAGNKIIDFKACNLHVVNYSIPIRKRLPLAELKEHLHTLPDQPDLIPYRTSYYTDTWGFCMSHRLSESLPDGEYEVCIKSTLEDGALTYGEYFLKGESDDEILISCHACHPSLANDNLSGISLVTHLARYLQDVTRRYSYRFLFIPGTIGSISWLARNEKHTDKIAHGLVAACVGDVGHMTYKRSRIGDADIDLAVHYVLENSGESFKIRDFSPYGYDERQFCSPGFNLPVGSLTRTPHGRFPEYHTSADNLDFIKPEMLADSFEKYLAVFDILENNRYFLNTNPKCEPQLGKRGLYRVMGGLTDAGAAEMAMLWILNLSDGHHSLLDIAERSGIAFTTIKETAHILHGHKLLDVHNG